MSYTHEKMLIILEINLWYLKAVGMVGISVWFEHKWKDNNIFHKEKHIRKGPYICTQQAWQKYWKSLKFMSLKSW